MRGEVAIAYRIKERLRDFYRERDPDTAHEFLAELTEHCRRPTMTPEIQKLGRTLHHWFNKINNYRIRALPYTGKPNWRVLNSIIVQYRPRPR